jgi:hypothetical protein
MDMELTARLDRIGQLVANLVERQMVKDWRTTDVKKVQSNCANPSAREGLDRRQEGVLRGGSPRIGVVL